MSKHILLRRAIASVTKLPPVNQATLSRHWALNADTTRRVVRDARLSPVPGPYRHHRYAWPDIWRLERVPESRILDERDHELLKKPLLTARDLACHFGCTETTIRLWARKGIIPSIRLGGSIRFRQSAIPWLEDRM